MILGLLEEARRAGARLEPACETIGLSVRTIQRWQTQGGGEDRRCGPHREPPNKLSAAERQEVLEVANSPQYRDLSPNQIVPRLADEGSYLASEATIYRVLLHLVWEPSRWIQSGRPSADDVSGESLGLLHLPG